MNKQRLWILAVSVILAHLCVVIWLHYGGVPESRFPLQEKLVVRTIHLTQEKKAETIPKKLPAQIKKSAPKKKQPLVKKTEKKTELRQEKGLRQEERMESLIAQARQQLSQVGKASKAMDQAKRVETLKIDGVEDHGYYSQLAACLKENLRLPEFGEVRVSLTLDCRGKVIQVKIISAQNENNKRYVEKILPKVNFPSFDQAFKNEKEHTFSITLANDL